MLLKVICDLFWEIVKDEICLFFVMILSFLLFFIFYKIIFLGLV